MSLSRSTFEENLKVNEICYDNINEQITHSDNKKRSGQHPNEYELMSHTPIRNNHDINSNPQLNKPNKNHQISDGTAASTSSYFNKLYQSKKTNEGSSTRARGDSLRQTFPPFRIALKEDNKYPATELFLIKEINNYFKLNFTYGRHAKTSDNKLRFLLYACSTTQFEHLMCKSNWRDKLCNSEYNIDLSSKIPPSYSIVVQNVSPQWNAQTFGDDLKERYPSIVRAVRLFINGGRPLSKVRLDFSSYKELSSILKSKRLLLDDNNTAYTVEPYLPPTRILRCYNCQAYNDHIAAHCPNKNDPVCFRCAQHHQYNPNCENIIQCAHCKGDHMAGNPSCPIKLEKRHEKNQQLKLSNETSITPSQQNKQAWSTNTNDHLFIGLPATVTGATSAKDFVNSSRQMDIANALDQINKSMIHIKQQQEDLNEKFNVLETKISNYTNDISYTKYCINDILCPPLKEISSQAYLKAKGVNKQAISPVYNRFVDFFRKNNISNSIEKLHTDGINIGSHLTSNSNILEITTNES